MMETLFNLSILFGLIIQQAVYIFLFCVAGLILFYIVKSLPETSCTGNCNQGRNCDCIGK